MSRYLECYKLTLRVDKHDLFLYYSFSKYIPISYDGSSAGNKLMQCNLFFPMFQGLVLMSATFQALFYPVLSPPSFGVNVQIMKCGKHQPTLLLCNQLRCCGRLQSSHKQISSAKFPFPMCQRLVDSIHLCHISCLPFWSIWRL